MTKIIFGVLLSVIMLTGCDIVTIKKATFKIPEDICSNHEGLLSATFYIDIYGDSQTINQVRCNNGATFDRDYIKEYKTIKNITTEV